MGRINPRSPLYSRRTRLARQRRALFDAVIDCLYEYDLGAELPERWPRRVREAIEAARKRILTKRHA